MTTGRLARAAGIIAVLLVVSRLLGLVREMVLAGAYGASGETDAFISSLVIVNSLAAILLFTLVTAVIPAFQRESAVAGEGSAWRLLWAVAAWSALGLVILSAVVALVPELVGRAVFVTKPERAADAAELLRIMAPAVTLQGLSALATALLQARGRFAAPAAVGVALNLGIIAGLLIGARTIGIEMAAWGVVAGGILQLAVQAPQFLRLHAAAAARPSIRHPRLAAVGALAVPVAAASFLQQINNITDKVFANTLDDGRTTALAFANTLGQVPRAALLLPLVTPLFPALARMIAEGRRDDAAAAVQRVAGVLGLVAVPLSAWIVVFPQELAQLVFRDAVGVFGESQCDADCVQQVGRPLLFYGLAVWGGFIAFLANRALAAAERTREVMVATGIVVVVTIALDFALIGPLEQAGLALASALAIAVGVVVSLLYLRRHLGGLSLRALALVQGRLVVAALLAVAVAVALGGPFPTDGRAGTALVGGLAAKTVAAGVVYLGAARLLAPAELREAGAGLKAMVRRRR